MKLVGWLILALICIHTGDLALVILLLGVAIGVAVAPRA
jgi:hypothetical protein